MDFLEFLDGAEPPLVQLAAPPDVLGESHPCRHMWVFAVPVLYLGFAEAFLLELENKLKKRFGFFFLYTCEGFRGNLPSQEILFLKGFLKVNCVEKASCGTICYQLMPRGRWA